MTLLEQVRKLVATNPGINQQEAAEALGRSVGAIRNALACARREKGIGARTNGKEEPARQHVTSEFGQDSGVLSSLHASIRTVDALLKAAEVDLSIWEVEKQIINKWEVVMREPATTVGGAGDDALISVGRHGEQSTLWTRKSNKPLHEPLWQVKVWLRRRTPRETALSSLLRTIEEKAPLLPKIRFPKVRTDIKDEEKALEVSIMDPHIGMLCFKGESDDPQNLESGAGLVLQAMDDLIRKGQIAAGREIFDQAFMPFGNDFTHTDNIEGATTAGTNQPEAISYHAVYDVAERVAIEMVNKLRRVARKVYVYEIPGNHSRVTDFTLSRVVRAWFHTDPNIIVDASADPYKFHRFGVNLIGFDHGHSISPIRLAGLMANERPYDLAEVRYKEWHLGDQHRKASSKPSAFEEQGVAIEYLPGLTAANGWHRHKAFNHQQRGAVGFVWGAKTGPISRFHFNVLKYLPKVA